MEPASGIAVRRAPPAPRSSLNLRPPWKDGWSQEKAPRSPPLKMPPVTAFGIGGRKSEIRSLSDIRMTRILGPRPSPQEPESWGLGAVTPGGPRVTAGLRARVECASPARRPRCPPTAGGRAPGDRPAGPSRVGGVRRRPSPRRRGLRTASRAAPAVFCQEKIPTLVNKNSLGKWGIMGKQAIVWQHSKSLYKTANVTCFHQGRVA